MKANIGRADAYAEGILPIIEQIKKAHVTSLREIARCLNARDFKTPNGRAFVAQSVKNIIERSTTDRVRPGQGQAGSVTTSSPVWAASESGNLPNR